MLRSSTASPAFAPAAALGLTWTLVSTEFKTRYQPTVGGFLWALAKPLAMFVVLMAVFSFIFGGDPAYRYHLIIGLFLWEFFAEATKAGLVSLHAKSYLLTKARFPAWIPVVTSVSNALITLAVFVVVIGAVLAAGGRAPGPAALALFLWYLAQYALIAVGFSLAASVLFLRYRDLNQVWDVVIQAGFFVAPIVYPLSVIPERFHLALYAWPPTAVVQFARAVLVDGAIPTATAHACLALETAIVLLLGLVVYRRMAPRIVESL
jgi:lipopolysaccharide transport system permease protein